MEIRRNDTLIVIDAGTGIRALGDHLIASQFRQIHLFIGHAHWDHIIGFPFFQPLYHPDFVIHVYGPRHEASTTEDALRRILEPHHFPVRLEELQATVHFHEVSPGDTHTLSDVCLKTTNCNHPGGALGFRLELPESTISYVTDNEFLQGYRGHPSEITLDDPLVEPYREFVEFIRGSDLLIHEAQYTPRMYSSRVGWGHSSSSNATALLKLAQIPDWIVTHHDPMATDDTLRDNGYLHWQILRDCGLSAHVQLAADGMRIPC